ncbi:MAG: ABC transporter substrate-binding protein [Bacillota bacterium]|nr:ABC transporter substrate-binding protein [Bacillota bacterium]
MVTSKVHRKWFTGVLAGLLLLVLTLPVLADEALKVGLITPLTGSVSTFGISVRNAVVMGVEQINEAGGINGRPIELIIYDDKGDATEAANSVRRLIDRDQVVLVIGPVITPCVLAAAPIAQGAGIPLMTPTGTGDTITSIGDMIFRAAYKDSFQGETMARFAWEKMGLKKVAVIYDVANDYSTGVMNAFRQKYQELGGEIVSLESYSTNDNDFSAQLTSIYVRKPEAVFIPDYYSAAGPIIMQARQLGIEVPLLGIDGWDSPELALLAGGYEEGGYFVNHYSTDDQTASTQAFIAAYEAQFGIKPDALAALGYDGILIVKAALEAADSTDPEAIRDALGTVTDIQGATGTINMDPEGTPVKSVVIIQIQNGQNVLVDKVDPN